MKETPMIYSHSHIKGKLDDCVKWNILSQNNKNKTAKRSLEILLFSFFTFIVSFSDIQYLRFHRLTH